MKSSGLGQSDTAQAVEIRPPQPTGTTQTAETTETTETTGTAGTSGTGTTRRRAHGLGLLLATATAVLLGWDLGRPGLWLDESASVSATQRSWPHLRLLLHGADAALVPYYTLLKLFTGAVVRLDPGAVHHPGVLYRVPSVLAAVAAVWLLTVWLARRCPPRLVIATGVALLSVGGVSRYGQEARPYAFTLLLAVVSTILWARLVLAGERRRAAVALDVVLYAGAVVLLVAAHLLAGSLVLAHLVAALTTSPGLTSSTGRERLLAARRTVLGAGLGLAVVAPFAVPAARQGVGPTTNLPITAPRLGSTFVGLFTGTGHPFLGIGVVLALAVVGVAQAWRPRYRFVARLALCWAVVPLLVLVPVVLARPNLLIGRYLVFLIPGWALLSGLGVMTAVEVAERVTRRRAPARVIGTLTGGALLLALVATQAGSLTLVRGPGGHSEDVRQALALADQPQYAGLPMYFTSGYSSLEIAPLHRADERRIVGQHVQRDLPSIWPVSLTGPAADRIGREHPHLLLMLRTPSPAVCRLAHPGLSTTAYVSACLPRLLSRQGYRVQSAQDAGVRWTFAVLDRPDPLP